MSTRTIATVAAVVTTTALVAVAAHAAPTGAFTLRGTVTHIVDGEAVDVSLGDGHAERVRLIGIDTPEIGQCGFARASRYARTVALGRGRDLARMLPLLAGAEADRRRL